MTASLSTSSGGLLAIVRLRLGLMIFGYVVMLVGGALLAAGLASHSGGLITGAVAAIISSFAINSVQHGLWAYSLMVARKAALPGLTSSSLSRFGPLMHLFFSAGWAVLSAWLVVELLAPRF